LPGKWRKGIWLGFYDWDPETASRETDFTFLRNKAHNVRCTSRYLRIAVFWDIKFSISSWSIFQLCILADLSRDENKMLRQLYRKTFAPERVRVAIMAPTSTSSLRIFVHAVHFVTCDIGLTTRWHEIRAQFRGRDERMMTTTRPTTTTTMIAAYRSRESRVLSLRFDCALSNVCFRDNHLERVYNSPRIFMFPAAANCDTLTGVTRICRKELSLNSPNDLKHVMLFLYISRII